MRTLSSVTLSLVAIVAMASTVGCHRATETVPANTTATVVTPDTSASHGTSGTAGSSGAGMRAGATGHDAAKSTTAMQPTTSVMPPAPGVKNNSGETQGTTPGTSLPTSDGSR